MPSMVFWREATGTSTGRLVLGVEADELSPLAPWCLERTPKRRLGDELMQLGERELRVVDVIAAILREVLNEALSLSGGEAPSEIRLTHPARWGQRRLEKLRQAARSAGIEDPTFVPEPVAAAAHFASRLLSIGEHVAVYDLGGGTFDTAVLERTDEAFAVVGIPGGDEELGGEDFDDLLYRHLGEQLDGDTWYQLRHSAGPGERAWPQANRELLRHARRAKEGLSRKSEYEFYLPQPIDHEFHATASDLERLIGPILRGTAAELERTILAAGRKPSELEAIYLAGGSSRIPLVGRILQQRLDRATPPARRSTGGDRPSVPSRLAPPGISPLRTAPRHTLLRGGPSKRSTTQWSLRHPKKHSRILPWPIRHVTPRRRPTDRSRPQPTRPSPVASGSTHRTSSEPPATPPTTRHVADSPPSATALSPPTPSWPSRAEPHGDRSQVRELLCPAAPGRRNCRRSYPVAPKELAVGGKTRGGFSGEAIRYRQLHSNDRLGPHIAEQVVCMPVSNATGQDIGEFHFYLYKALTDRRAAFRLAKTVADRRAVEPIQTGQDCNHNFSDGYWYDTGRSRHTVGGQALCYTDKTRASHLFVTFKGSRVLMDGLRPDENHGALWDWFITNISHDFSLPR